jgi:hypothetical protein
LAYQNEISQNHPSAPVIPVARKNAKKKKEGIKDMQALKATFCTLLLIRNS